MKHLLQLVQSALRLPSRPSMGRITTAVLSAAVLGAALGPLFSALIEFVGGAESLRSMMRHPLSWGARSFLLGALFGSAFYTTCGLPQMLLQPLVQEYPPKIQGSVRAILGAIGGTLGFVIVAYVSGSFLGITFYSNRSLAGIAIIDAVAGAVLALVIGAFVHLKQEVERGQRIQREKDLREIILLETASRAQAKALQMQINPHFFFNTLNTISALIGEDPQAAQRIISSLAEMFRYSLACTRSESVSLKDELDFVSHYLDVEKSRMGDRLRVRVEVGVDASRVLVPGLILQPIVENAIRHGVAKRMGGGELQIFVRTDSDCLYLHVRNQFEPAEGSPELAEKNLFQEGHSLETTRRRLQLYYPGSYLFQASREDEEWVGVKLTVPIGAKQ